MIAEGVVAKEVLTSQGLWELGTKYNKAVARSVEAALPSEERSRAGAAMFHTFRFEAEVGCAWRTTGGLRARHQQVLLRRAVEQGRNDAPSRGLLAELGLVDEEQSELALNQDALIAIQVALRDIYVGSRENFARYNIKADAIRFEWTTI